MYISTYSENEKLEIKQNSAGRESYRETVEKYQSLVYGIALNRTGHKFDADDIFQEVFLTYFSKKNIFKSEDHRKAWLIRTTLNCCKRHLHNSWNIKTTGFEEAAENSAELSYSFDSQEENDIFTAMRQLPEKYRIVLHLFYFEEYSTEEIAKAVRISAPNVRMRLNRGRNMMRNILKEDYFHE